jgi:hypothetical protein
MPLSIMTRRAALSFVCRRKYQYRECNGTASDSVRYRHWLCRDSHPRVGTPTREGCMVRFLASIFLIVLGFPAQAQLNPGGPLDTMMRRATADLTQAQVQAIEVVAAARFTARNCPTMRLDGAKLNAYMRTKRIDLRVPRHKYELDMKSAAFNARYSQANKRTFCVAAMKDLGPQGVGFFASDTPLPPLTQRWTLLGQTLALKVDGHPSVSRINFACGGRVHINLKRRLSGLPVGPTDDLYAIGADGYLIKGREFISMARSGEQEFKRSGGTSYAIIISSMPVDMTSFSQQYAGLQTHCRVH